MIPDDMPWEPWPCQQCHHPVHDPEPCTVESGPARIICNCGPATRQQPVGPGDLRTTHAAYHNAGYGWGHPNGPQPPDVEPCWCPIGRDHDADATEQATCGMCGHPAHDGTCGVPLPTDHWPTAPVLAVHCPCDAP